MYLAAEDTKAATTDNCTPEERLTHFIGELALLGRMHNKKNSPLAVVDDLGPDRPACGQEAGRRLLQSLLRHPLTACLTRERVTEEICDFFRETMTARLSDNTLFSTQTIEYLWAENQRIIGAAPDVPQKVFRLLDIPKPRQLRFKQQLTQWYNEALNQDLQWYVDEHFKSELPHYLEFCLKFNLDGILYYQCQQRKDGLLYSLSQAKHTTERIAILTAPFPWNGKNIPTIFCALYFKDAVQIIFEKLDAITLAQVLFSSDTDESELHRFLEIDINDFKLLLEKLDPHHLLQLLRAKKEDRALFKAAEDMSENITIIRDILQHRLTVNLLPTSPCSQHSRVFFERPSSQEETTETLMRKVDIRFSTMSNESLKAVHPCI